MKNNKQKYNKIYKNKIIEYYKNNYKYYIIRIE